MRIAVVSDIHGNLTAFEAVIADLRHTAPDLVVLGGDLVSHGSSPAEVVDRVRDLGWPGVMGNTDDMLRDPDRLRERAERVPKLRALFDAFREALVPFAAAALGDERLQWLHRLPMEWSAHDLTVLHAAPGDLWRGAMPDAPDADLTGTYRSLGTARVVYGHIHRPFVRELADLTVANSGSVSLSYDGDSRASYAIVDEGSVSIRRVAYDVEREITELAGRRHPRAAWLSQMLRGSAFVPPSEVAG